MSIIKEKVYIVHRHNIHIHSIHTKLYYTTTLYHTTLHYTIQQTIHTTTLPIFFKASTIICGVTPDGRPLNITL